MNTPNLRVSIAFAGESDLKLLAEGDIVSAALFDNPNYTSVPMSQTEFDAPLNEFRIRLAAKPEGGPQATARKNEARTLLVAKMKELAYYVQTACNNVLSVLLSSGFKAVSTNRTSAPLPAPVIEKLVHGQSGELLLTAKPVPNARGYERQMALVAADGTLGEYQNLGFSKSARRLSTSGLIAGQRYAFRIRAMGGSTEQSDWSEAAMIICL
jgi:hypothetical protein